MVFVGTSEILRPQKLRRQLVIPLKLRCCVSLLVVCSSCVSPCAWNNDLFLGYEIFGTLKKKLVRFTGLSKPFQFRSIDVERSKPSYLWVPLLVGAACALVHAHIYHGNYKVDPVDLPYYFRTEIPLLPFITFIGQSQSWCLANQTTKKTILSNLGGYSSSFPTFGTWQLPHLPLLLLPLELILQLG